MKGTHTTARPRDSDFIGLWWSPGTDRSGGSLVESRGGRDLLLTLVLE